MKFSEFILKKIRIAGVFLDCFFVDYMRIDILVYPARSLYDTANYREQETGFADYNGGCAGVVGWGCNCLYDWYVAV